MAQRACIVFIVIIIILFQFKCFASHCKFDKSTICFKLTYNDQTKTFIFHLLRYLSPFQIFLFYCDNLVAFCLHFDYEVKLQCIFSYHDFNFQLGFLTILSSRLYDVKINHATLDLYTPVWQMIIDSEMLRFDLWTSKKKGFYLLYSTYHF